MQRANFIKFKKYLTELSGQMAQIPELKSQVTAIETIVAETSEPLLIMVMGEFSTGKSTFINALLKKDIAKIGATPTTAVITKLSYGITDKIEVVFRDGTKRNYSTTEFENLTSESNAQYNDLREKIEYVARYLPIDILKNMTLIDCPGLNSIKAAHENTTRNFMNKADSVIWLFDAKNPAKQTEFTAFKNLNPRLKPVVVLNKTDTIDEEDGRSSVASTIADIERKLRNNKLTAQKIIGISARMALQGVQRNDRRLIAASNIEEFYNFLNSAVFANRDEYKQNSTFEEAAYAIYNIFKVADTIKLDESTIKNFNNILKKIVEFYADDDRERTDSPSESLLVGTLLHNIAPRDSISFLREAADVGNNLAALMLGLVYFKIEDYTQAFSWSKKAADAGAEDAFALVGQMYLTGQGGVQQDAAQAFHWIKKAAEAGDPYALLWLGLMYRNGTGVSQNYSQAFSCFKKAADTGNTAAFSWLGLMYRNGEGVTANYIHSFNWFKKAADSGDTKAFYWLGLIYYKGNGVTKNYAQALLWFKKAADANDQKAFYWLGLMYYNGESIARNYSRSFYWFKEAADANDQKAFYWLGIMYHDGEGVAQNYLQAFYWFKEAADAGDTEAFFWLGIMYRDGESVSKDWYKASTWFKKSADNGDAISMRFVAQLYRYGGHGLTKDYDEALKWYQKAIDAGDSEARTEKSELENEIARSRSVSTYSGSSSSSYSSSSRKSDGAGGMVIGGLIGAALGGPVGAIIGGWLGSKISSDD